EEHPAARGVRGTPGPALGGPAVGHAGRTAVPQTPVPARRNAPRRISPVIRPARTQPGPLRSCSAVAGRGGAGLRHVACGRIPSGIGTFRETTRARTGTVITPDGPWFSRVPLPARDAGTANPPAHRA